MREAHIGGDLQGLSRGLERLAFVSAAECAAQDFIDVFRIACPQSSSPLM